MKIIITGASGFVGNQLVPLLEEEHDLLLVGRDTSRLNKLFPHIDAYSYASLDERGRDFDILLHLAGVNNNTNLPSDTIISENMSLASDITSICRRLNIGKLIFASSIMVLDPENMTAYTKSKRQVDQMINEQTDIPSAILHLPALYGVAGFSKFWWLSKVSKSAARYLSLMVKAYKPSLELHVLANHLKSVQGNANPEECLFEEKEKDFIYRLFSKTIDAIFVLSVFSVLLPVLVFISTLIKLESPGPAVFRQERVGKNGETFQCLKFRSMHNNAPNVPTHLSSKTSVTRVGNFIRRFKIDELPQAINVLKGDMALIGPRPCLPTQKDLIEARRKRGVLAIKPGITGWSQVYGVDMSDDNRLALWDARYLAQRSIWVDARIILRTVFARKPEAHGGSK